MVLCVPLGVVRARVVWQLHLERSIQRRLPRCAYEDTVRAQAAEGALRLGGSRLTVVQHVLVGARLQQHLHQPGVVLVRRQPQRSVAP